MADERELEAVVRAELDTEALAASTKKGEKLLDDFEKKAKRTAKATADSAADMAKKMAEGNRKFEEGLNSIGRTARNQLAGAPSQRMGRRRTAEEKQAEAEEKKRQQEARERGWAQIREERRQGIEQRRVIRETGWAQNRERREQERLERRNQREADIQARRSEREQIRETARIRREADREEVRQKKIVFQRERAETVAQQRDLSKIRGITDRILLAPAAEQRQISSILNAPGAYTARMGMVNVGMTRTQAFATQLQAGGIAPSTALYAAGAGGRRPPGWGGGGAGGGPTGTGAGFFGRGGVGRQMLRSAATAVGFGVTGFGAYAAIQAGRSVVESTEMATAYERQRVAAESLAGSQANLNALLVAYAEASGGAVDKVDSLANVTRLLATGFAKTVPEAERFVRATRGASIALGRPNNEVTQETQLAISNTSVKRLDQIGLGIEEVNARIEELRANNSSWTREMAFQDAVLSVMEEKYGHLTETVEGQATGLERLGAAWRNLRLGMGQAAKGPVDAAAGGIAGALDLSDNPKTSQAINSLLRAILAGKGINPDAAFRANRLQALEVIGDDRALNASTMSGSIRSRGRPLPRFDEDALEGMNALRQAEIDIARRWDEERLSATEDYESQRTTIIRNYEKQIAREAEDFAIRRARSNRDFNKSVTDLIEDAGKRDAEMTEDYTERVAEAREDSEKRIAEMNEDYQKQREKDFADHRDRLLKAAGQLDAIAVLEERKRWRREGKEQEEAHKEQIDKAREALAEQLEDAREAYEERLEEAREADRERLQDMRDARVQQLADEDADRALQLERAKEDHDEQLGELDRQHGLRMQQIEEQARKEREQWQKEFEDFAIEHNIYIAGLTEKRKKIDELTVEWFDKLVEELEKRIKGFETNPAGGARPDVPGVEALGFAKGGPVGRTGPAILHAGEFVLSRDMLTGNQPVPSSVANAINNKSILLQAGAIAIAVNNGATAGEVVDELEDRLVEIFNRT